MSKNDSNAMKKGIVGSALPMRERLRRWKLLAKHRAALLSQRDVALKSARAELIRQRAIWTGSKNESWAIACIDSEVSRINRVIYNSLL